MLSRNRLDKLVNKLKKDPEQLAEYNDVIMRQLELGVIENADNIPTTIGEVTYDNYRRGYVRQLSARLRTYLTEPLFVLIKRRQNYEWFWMPVLKTVVRV